MPTFQRPPVGQGSPEHGLPVRHSQPEVLGNGGVPLPDEDFEVSPQVNPFARTPTWTAVETHSPVASPTESAGSDPGLPVLPHQRRDALATTTSNQGAGGGLGEWFKTHIGSSHSATDNSSRRSTPPVATQSPRPRLQRPQRQPRSADAPPTIVDTLRASVATSVARRAADKDAAKKRQDQYDEDQKTLEQEMLDRNLAAQQAQQQRHARQLSVLNRFDGHKTQRAIEDLTGARAHASIIERPEHLRLPTIKEYNEKVRVVTAAEISANDIVRAIGTAVEPSSGVDTDIVERMQTSALFRGILAQQERDRVARKEPPMDRLTTIGGRKSRREAAQQALMEIVIGAETKALESTYVNPQPKEYPDHREYAFALTTEVARVPKGRSDTLVGTRQTVVTARLVVGPDGNYHYLPEADGITPVLQRCGDPNLGEGSYLRNVTPGGLDGRASGIIVRRAGDNYPGGLTAEVRYAGNRLVEPAYFDEKGNPIPQEELLEAFLNPQFDAVFEIEARHVTADTYNRIMAINAARDDLVGKPPYVDIRAWAAIEAQAAKDVAVKKFKEFSVATTNAHGKGRTAVEDSMVESGFGQYLSSILMPPVRELEQPRVV